MARRDHPHPEFPGVLFCTVALSQTRWWLGAGWGEAGSWVGGALRRHRGSSQKPGPDVLRLYRLPNLIPGRNFSWAGPAGTFRRSLIFSVGFSRVTIPSTWSRSSVRCCGDLLLSSSNPPDLHFLFW